MAGIGGVGCTFVKGAAQSPKEEVETWRVPGLDGYGAQLLGLGDSSFQFTGILWTVSKALAVAWVEAIEDLQGQVIDVIDDWGTDWGNLLVTKVGQPKFRAIIAAGGITCRAEVEVEGIVLPESEE